MSLPAGFTLLPGAGAAGRVVPAAQGYQITDAWDEGKRWKRAGANYAKDEEGRWVILVRDLTTLVRCAVARGPLQVSPDVAKHLAARERWLEQSRATDAAINIPAPEGLKYLPFQRGGIAYALARKGVLFGDEMGLGKTIQVLGLINASAATAHAIRSALVVCPASLKLNWLREAQRWLVERDEWRFWVADERGRPCPAWCNFAIVNYDRMAKHSELNGRTWDLIAADEAHYAKNPKARRTRLLLGGPAIAEKRDPLTNELKRAAQPEVRGLMESAKRRALLTGTPLPNRPHELYTIAHALAPASFPNEGNFIRRYCGGAKNGSSNLDELQEKMRAAFMVRRLKKDVLTDLPPKVRQVITLPIDGAEAQIEHENAEWQDKEQKLEELRADVALAKASGDEEAFRDAVKKLREGERIAFTEIAKVRHETALVKVPYVLEHIRELFEGGLRKLLVFAHHRDVLHKLRAGLDDLAPAYIDGDTPIAMRQAEVDRFQTAEECRAAVLSITAAGVGLTLTEASTVAFAELDWVPGNITQAEDRAHRIGQRDSVHVLHLVFDGSLDSRMAKTLVEKQELAELALDRKVDTAKVAELLSRTAVPMPAEARERKPPPKRFTDVADNDRAAILLALQQLAGVCDGANRRDDSGFSAFDAKIGHSLARQHQLSHGQAWLGARLVRKYQRQLDSGLVEIASRILAAGDGGAK